MDSAALTVEQLAGQRLMFGFDGSALSGDLRHLIGDLKAGGVILFSRNVEGPDALAALCRELQACARRAGQPPLLIAIDQEGGPVARLKPPFTQFAGPAAMQAEAEALAYARTSAAELKGVGINMNMAPVMDIVPRGIPSIMAGRAFGHDPARVARMGTLVIGELQRCGVMAVAKHFPGIGRTTLDSHLDLPVLETRRETLEGSDLLPFRAAVAHGVAGVMLSHILYRGLDPLWPASLSPAIARGLLREAMGYDGVVMSDDLDMGAIAGRWDTAACMRQILEAEVDLALICHRGPAMETAFETLVTALQRDPTRIAAARRSAQRILELKRRYIA
jgi:beta-N-acetylhexosaminidase